MKPLDSSQQANRIGPSVGVPAAYARYEPRLHDTVMDERSMNVGRVMGHVGHYVQLRPVGGGLEWDARPQDLRPATTAEARGECP